MNFALEVWRISAGRKLPSAYLHVFVRANNAYTVASGPASVCVHCSLTLPLCSSDHPIAPPPAAHPHPGSGHLPKKRRTFQRTYL